MIRLMQYMISPRPTRQIRASWFLQILGPTLPTSGIVGGGGSSLYHSFPSSEQGMTEVKKLSKHNDNAADHAHMKSISSNVCASFPDVCHSPRGRPKYSSYARKSGLVNVGGD